MTSKMISIKEEIYKKLKLLKKEEQSFSDIIEELMDQRKKDPLAHFGIGNELPEEDLDFFEASIKQSREQQIALIKDRTNEREV